MKNLVLHRDRIASTDMLWRAKDRKAGVMKKPAAAGATSGKGNLPKDKSAAAQSKTDGQGQAKKNKKGRGKGKGKLSKDKGASQKGQGKEEKQQAEGSQGRTPSESSPLFEGRLYPEELCSHVQASRNMGKAPRLLGAARGRVPARGPQRGHSAVEEERLLGQLCRARKRCTANQLFMYGAP